MTVTFVASAAALSAPVVVLLTILVVVLLCWRAASTALGYTLTRNAQRVLDLSIALSLVVFAICVYSRFKVIG